MTKKNEESFLKLLGAKGAIKILRFVNQHDTGQYKEMKEFVNMPTLNQRLRDLLGFGLIGHHYVKAEKKVEWYSLTEKGRKVLGHVEAILMLVDDQKSSREEGG